MEKKQPAQRGRVEKAAVDHSEAVYNAVTDRDVARLRELLAEGASPDVHYYDEHNISSKYILHIACGIGYCESVRALLEAGATPDCCDCWGQTPLFYCFCMLYLDCARVILEHLHPSKVADIVNKQDCYGKACLHSAAEGGEVEAVHLLLKHGAEINIRNFDGYTPLMVCAQPSRRHKSMEVMRALIEAGALIDLVDYRSNRSALQIAAVSRNVKAVEILLSAGAQVDELDVTRRTALTNVMWDHIWSRHSASDIDMDIMTVAVMLVQGGADVNLAVCEYCNPLVVAAFLQATPLLLFFLEQGANPNVIFSSGVTPLLIATGKKDMDGVKTLLRYNCSMTAKGKVFRRRVDTEFTFDPIEMALDDGSYRLVQLFLAAGYNSSTIHQQLREKLAAEKSDMEKLAAEKSNTEKLAAEKSDSEESHMDAALLQWLTERISTAPSLRELAVYSLRRSLDQRIHTAAPLLPLPAKVKDFILLKDLLKLREKLAAEKSDMEKLAAEKSNTEKLAAEKSDSEESHMDAALLQWLTERISTAPSLRELAVYSLRRSLDQRIHTAAPLLPLPAKVKDFILLKDLLKVD